MEKVSIVVPIYNAEQFLEPCVESILSQTYQNIEILLVNDGSKDSSGKLCDSYAQKDSRVKVLHRENSGVSATRNCGIEHASGEYLMFVDSDDALEPDTVEKNLALAKEKNLDLVIYSFRYHFVDDRVEKPNQPKQSYFGEAEDFFENCFTTLLDLELINPPWNKLIKKSIVDDNQIRFHKDFSICEDMAFSTQVLAACKRIGLNREMYYHYNLKSTGTLVFKFHANYYEALSFFYDQALEYCRKFTNHEVQVRRLQQLFVNLAFVQLKRICCNETLDKKVKYEMMHAITEDDRLKTACREADLNWKKRLTCRLIKKKNFWLLDKLYRIKGLK